MAGKKKKKSAVNSARGFATTSLPSKAKVPTTDESATAEAASLSASSPIPGADSGGKENKSPDVLTEEEQEYILLDAIVQKLGPKARREGQRIATRMEVEKRTLRKMCFPLDLNKLFGFNLLRSAQEKKFDGVNKEEIGLGEQVLSLARDEFNQLYGAEVPEKECKRGETLLANAWVLHKTLISIGFPRTRIEEGLQQLARVGSNGLDKEKGLDAAMEELLDWLALNCEEKELPGFSDDVGKGDNKGRGLADVTLAGIAPAPGTTTPRQPQPPEAVTQHLRAGTSRPNADSSPPIAGTADEAEAAAGSQTDEGDMDTTPEELIPQYIKLQTRIYHLHPASTVVMSGKKGKKGPNPPPPLPGIANSGAAELKKLQSKLEVLVRDPLLDLRDAEEVWRIERMRLENESRASQQSQGNSVPRRNRQPFQPNEADIGRAPLPTSSVVTTPTGGDSDSDTGGFLGGLFEPPPTEEAVTGEGDASGECEKVEMRDFEEASSTGGNFGKGKPKGKAGVGASTVRRVLEEVCRSRDVNSRLRFEAIPGTSISVRSRLTLTWSSIAAASASSVSPLPGPTGGGRLAPVVISTPTLLTTTFSMASFAAMTKDQADGYIATYALFKLCSKRDEKIYLRLPTIWRALWSELLDEGQRESERQERETLRDLRKTLKITEKSAIALESTHSTRPRTVKDTGGARGIPEAGRQGWGKTMDPKAIQGDWEYRANRPEYLRMLEHRRHLPMWAFRTEVLAAIEKEQIVIICGETGCGKSTQTPAFILEHELSQGKSCRIYCTEPRRISAISLARRVSEELGERKSELGGRNSLVGFAIRLESNMHSGTRLVYATTGIVMRMLERSPELEEVTHLILDEVHERSIDSDFLLIVLKKLLLRRKDLKVILMSATVDAGRFSKYLGDAPVMNVPGRTFPVRTYYLEDAIELVRFTTDSDSRKPLDKNKWEEEDIEDTDDKDLVRNTGGLMNYSQETRDTLSRMDAHHINYELIIRLLEYVAYSPEFMSYSQAILVFLPGMGEIRRLNDMLMGHPKFQSNRSNGGWLIYPLHSTVSSEDQEAAFLLPPPGVRKIVIATNIAETGITIPDVTCVIDSGKHKEMRFDEKQQLSRLVETFISRANAKQRRGRAGRVQEGLCFHLFTKDRHDNLMASQQTPEIMRLSLQDLVLRVKICKLGKIEEVLTQALDPPSAKNIRRATDSLLEVKALTVTEELTNLGRQLAKLPLDVYLGKLVLLGCIYGCLDAALTIAAIQSSKSPFVTPMGFRAEAESCRLSFKRGDSDLLTGWNAYCSWRRVCQGNTMMSEHEFCRRNFLSARNLSAIEELKQQLLVAVIDAGFLTLTDSERAFLNRCRFVTYRRRNFFIAPDSVNYSSDNDSVVNSVIAAGFYPKLLAREGRGWRNIVNNQNIAIHPSSVNRHTKSDWMAYYYIMRSNKFYDAHETSHVDDISIALLCGDGDFKMYAGTMILDCNRVRFLFQDWKSMITFKILRSRLHEITARLFRTPGKGLSENQRKWLEIFHQVFQRARQLQAEKAAGEQG